MPAVSPMYTEDVAKAAGVEEVTIRRYLTRSQARADAGKPVEAWMLPLPAGYVRRKTTTKGGHVRTVARSPQWEKADIDRWLRDRLGPGGHPRKEEPASA